MISQVHTISQHNHTYDMSIGDGQHGKPPLLSEGDEFNLAQIIEVVARMAFMVKRPDVPMSEFSPESAPPGSTTAKDPPTVSFYDGLVEAWPEGPQSMGAVVHEGTADEVRYRVALAEWEKRGDVFPGVMVDVYTYCTDCDEQHLVDFAFMIHPGTVARFMHSWVRAE